jgi:hypothetical protein
MSSFDLGRVLKSSKKSEDKANQLKEVITENISICVSTDAVDFKYHQMCQKLRTNSKDNGKV